MKDSWMRTEFLFLNLSPFQSKLDSSNSSEDAKMTPIESETPILSEPLQKRTSISPLRPITASKDFSLNLRDKCNLQKYTKSLQLGKSLLKHRLNEHKETFLPKPYTPFKFANHQLYRQIRPEEIDKIMREINLSQNFEVDYVELLTKYEFPAVLRLKKKFMSWFCKYMRDKIQAKKMELEEKKAWREEEERVKRAREEEEEEVKGKKEGHRESKREVIVKMDVEEIDVKEDGPASVLEWAFWGRKGQRRLSGRLIPFRANQFIHVNWALWTKGVFDDKEGHILNFYFEYKKAKLTKWSLCNEFGASVSWERGKWSNVYHFPWALSINWHFTIYNRHIVYCPSCAQLYNFQLGYGDQKKILDTKRRLYIVKHKEFYKDMLSATKVKVDTWRPYFYDSFNRVGNCTILSLCENVDALIKVIKGGSFSLHNDLSSKTAFLSNPNFQLKPYTCLRLYWKIFKNPTLEHSKLLSIENMNSDGSKGFYL